MKKYRVSLTNIEHLQSIEVEAETRDEAVEKATQVFEDGNAYVYSNELKTDGVFELRED